ncbi:MAG: glucose-1-phosphate cytidylyltransferase [Myxococcota bacterium]|jgi:glucose-1-phosphate cytidylyltransferase
MKVVILCGGLGTRLREETEYRPKPMVEVGGKPIVLHIMKTFAHYGLKDFILCLGYKGDSIKDYFLNYEEHCNDFTLTLGAKRHPVVFHREHSEQDFRVTMADTGPDTMTGGRIKRIQKYVEDDLFMVTYGDGLADVNIKDLIAFHKSHGKLATVTSVRPVSRFGQMHMKGNLVTRFAEKPQEEGWMNAGYFVFNRKVFDYLGGDATILEREPLESLARDGQLVAFLHEGFFFAMDTYREYKMLNEMWASGKAPWRVWK